MKHTSLPHIELIRAVFGKESFDHKDWSFEFKYDGFRGLLYVDSTKAQFVSRQDKVLHQFDELAAEISHTLRWKVQNAIFDGELVTKDKTERPIFSDILHKRGTPSYVAFDLLWLNGEDLRTQPLSQRRKALRRILPPKSKRIEQAYAVEGAHGKKLLEFICENDLEGIVAKRPLDLYLKPTKWYKIKNPEYSQVLGRKDFFNNVRRKAAR